MENTEKVVETGIVKDVAAEVIPVSPATRETGGEVGVYISHTGRAYTEAPVVGAWAMFQTPKMTYPAFGTLKYGSQVGLKADFALLRSTNKGDAKEITAYFSTASLKYCFSASKVRLPYPK